VKTALTVSNFECYFGDYNVCERIISDLLDIWL